MTLQKNKGCHYPNKDVMDLKVVFGRISAKNPATGARSAAGGTEAPEGRGRDLPHLARRGWGGLFWSVFGLFV